MQAQMNEEAKRAPVNSADESCGRQASGRVALMNAGVANTFFHKDGDALQAAQPGHQMLHKDGDALQVAQPGHERGEAGKGQHR